MKTSNIQRVKNLMQKSQSQSQFAIILIEVAADGHTLFFDGKSTGGLLAPKTFKTKQEVSDWYNSEVESIYRDSILIMDDLTFQEFS